MNKPLRMADLPRHVYRCADDTPVVARKPIDPNSYTQRLQNLEVEEYVNIPKTCAGLVSRVAQRANVVFKTLSVDKTTLRVTRIK